MKEQVGESALVPALAPVGDAPVVQGLAYLLQAVALKGTLEYLPHHRGGGRVYLQRGTLLRTVVDLDTPIAEGGLGAEEKPLEAASRIPLVTSWAKFSL